MAFDIVAWHDRNGADHGAQLNKFAAEGFRTMSLCVYGDRNDPRYVAVMVLRPVLVAEKQLINLSSSDFQTSFDQMAAQGWGPTILSATGPANNPSFAVCFSPMASIPLTRTRLFQAEFNALNQAQMNARQILMWADVYGDPGDLRYIGIWGANPDQRAWNCDAVDDNDQVTQARFDALVSGYGRVVHVGRTPEAGALTMYDDSTMASWHAHTNLSSAGYQALYDSSYPQGLRPVRVAAKGVGAGARFSALFTSQEKSDPRGIRRSDLSKWNVLPQATIDDAMIAMMTANMLHGGSVAVVTGTQLVYARGYTIAEPGYPDIQPTTLFRQASVSKVYTAAAIYQLIEEGTKLSNGTSFTLNTWLGDVLPELANGPPVAAWGEITIRNLMEMKSGLTQEILGVDASVSSILPITSLMMGKWLYRQPLGAKTSLYSNAGYMLLSMVVTKLRGASSFIQAITPTLLDKLHIPSPGHPVGARSAVSLAAGQLPDEARYHSRPLATAPSVMVTGQPPCAQGYGEWNLEMTAGAGGLSASAPDVARLLAALSVSGANPMMSNATLQTWMANAATGGFHGFDGTSVIDPVNHLYSGYKGGSLSTSQNGVYFEMGGVSVVLCWNGTTPASNVNPPTGPAWYPKYSVIVEFARSHDWEGIDLFPKFGMPSFDPVPIKILGPLPPGNPVPFPIHMQPGMHGVKKMM